MKPLELFHEYFRVALKAKLNDLGWGSQGKLADVTGIGRIPLNNYLGGRSNLSEERKELICKALEVSYDEMIDQGYRLIKDAGGKADLYSLEDTENSTVVPFDESISHPGYQQSCQELNEIYRSGDPGLISAISSNLREFASSAHKQKRIDDLEARMDMIEGKDRAPLNKQAANDGEE